MPLELDIKIGCDIVEVSRIEKMMSQPDAIKKIFHPSETTKFEAEHLAGIFAVKEAAFKALGIRSNSWLSMEVRPDAQGKPGLIFANDLNLSEIISLDCSISHDGGFAFAVVSILKKK